MFTLIAITSLFGAAVAAPHGGLGLLSHGHGVAVDSYAYPRYEYNYAVHDPHTGDNKAQKEVRDGDVVKGSYSLTEPDGTLRVVEYTADSAHGFNAIVKRIGGAVHPQTLLAPVISKHVIEPIAEPVVAPIAAPIYKDIGYSADLYGLDGWDTGLGLGLGGSWHLGGHGGWKH